MPGGLDGFFREIGQAFVSFQAAPEGVPRRIWDELRPWMLRLAVHAAPKWLPRMGFGFACSVEVYEGGKAVGPCPSPAIAACDVCAQACCLNHARIDQFGDAICYRCVVEAIKRRRAEQPVAKPAPTVQDIVWARRLLRVKADTEWDTVRATHRRLSAKWHPDRHQGEAEKAKAEAKFKEIQRAFDLLNKEHERGAAAHTA